MNRQAGERCIAPRAVAISHDAGTAGAVGPRDCAIAFGVPTCQGGFEGRRLYGTSEYARRFSGWPEYEVRFVRFLTELEPGLRDVGVTVARDVTSSDFAKLFERHRVVILFSHWKDEAESPHFPLGAVELDEGLVDIDTIVESVPPDYDGFLDLCVCHPKNLRGALLHSRPRCRIKWIEKKAEPDFWLYFYGTLFRRLSETAATYPNALRQTRAELIGEPTMETHDVQITHDDRPSSL